MHDEDSPYRSPTLDSSGEQMDERVVTLTWLLGWVQVALFVYILAYGAIFLASQFLAPLANSVNNLAPDPFREATLKWFIIPVVLILNPAAVLFGGTAVFLLWRRWENWRGATIVALLSLIPLLSLPVLAYSLWRGSQEIRKLHRQELTKEKATG